MLGTLNFSSSSAHKVSLSIMKIKNELPLCTYVIMEGARNFGPLINTTGLCPQILVKVGITNLYKNSFVGSQAVPCGKKD